MNLKLISFLFLGALMFPHLSFNQEKEKSQLNKEPVRLKKVSGKNANIQQVKVLSKPQNKKVEKKGNTLK